MVPSTYKISVFPVCIDEKGGNGRAQEYFGGQFSLFPCQLSFMSRVHLLQIIKTEGVSVYTVAFSGGLLVEGPLCKEGRVSTWMYDNSSEARLVIGYGFGRIPQGGALAMRYDHACCVHILPACLEYWQLFLFVVFVVGFLLVFKKKNN